MIKKPCSSRFSLHKFDIFGLNSKTSTYEVRAAWGRVSRGLTVYQAGSLAFLKLCKKNPIGNRQVILKAFKAVSRYHSDLNDQNLFHSTIDAPSRVPGVSKIANFETTQFMEDPLIWTKMKSINLVPFETNCTFEIVNIVWFSNFRD